MRPTAWVAAGLCLVLPAASAAAQANDPPFYTDSLAVELGTRFLWRGIERGSFPISASYAMSVWGANAAGRGQWLFNADATSALSDRLASGYSDQVHVTFGRVAHLDGNGSRFWIGAGGYYLPSISSGNEVYPEAEAALAVRIPWLDERRPLWIIEAATDVTGDRGSHLRTALQLDYKVSPRLGVFLLPGFNWGNIPVDGVSPTRKFGPGALTADVALAYQSDPETSDRFSWSLSPRFQYSRSRWNAHRNTYNLGLRFTLIL